MNIPLLLIKPISSISLLPPNSFDNNNIFLFPIKYKSNFFIELFNLYFNSINNSYIFEFII